MPFFVYPDPYMRKILRETRTIALIGASANPERDSYRFFAYMQSRGYRVIPVNPGLAGGILLGETVYGTLDEIPESFDMVDIFRPSKDVGPVVDEAIRLAPEKGIRTIWMQLGVCDVEAAKRAEAAGLDVVMLRCPKIEHMRLMA